jgi:hypothetical protein
MSELVHARANRVNFRWQLLVTASAIALLACSYGAGETRAADEDSDRSPLWIELGGQLSRLSNDQEAFSPLLMAGRPVMFSPSQEFERPSLYSIDEEGKISFQPDGSNWIFAASVRYGRSGSDKHVRQQTHPAPVAVVLPTSTVHKYPDAAKFADTNAKNSEDHFILDFQVGNDVGIGMFGAGNGSSVINFGVRFAQFSSRSNIALKSDPDWHFNYKYVYNYKITDGQPYHSNVASLTAARSFHGIGPSISWNASAPLAGNSRNGEFSVDWGANAAFLFGRQRAEIHHQTTAEYASPAPFHQQLHIVGTPINTNHARSRSVTVPNIGGFAGASFRIENFKVSAGYRADLFFGAMDGGIDAAKKENVGFYGPFATISVGLGG